MTIYAIRHFITSWNQAGKLQGSADIQLANDEPKNEVLKDRVLAAIEAVKPDAVLVSPKKRAIGTADLLGLKNYTVEELATEMSFGRFEGVPKQQMIDEMEGKWESDPMSTELRPSLMEMEQRIEKFIDRYKQLDSCLLISHGAFIRALKSYIESGNLDHMNRFELNNGELLTLSV